MIAGQHDSSLPSDNNVNHHNESDRYEVEERKRLSIEQECLLKQLFMLCVNITLKEFKQFLLSQKISPLLSSKARTLVPGANDFTSLWEICKGKFEWCDRALLRHLLHYVPKCNHDMVQEIIRNIEKNKNRYLSLKADGLPASTIKLDSQHDYIPESELEQHQLSAFMTIPYKHVYLRTDQALQKQNPGSGVNQQEWFTDEPKQESQVINDLEGVLVPGRCHSKVDLPSTSDSQTNESEFPSVRDKTLQSTVAPFLSKYPSPPIPQSLIM